MIRKKRLPYTCKVKSKNHLKLHDGRMIDRNKSDLSIGYSITNNTSRPITVLTRTGVKYRIPAKYGATVSHGTVLIDSNYHLSSDVNINENDLLNSKENLNIENDFASAYIEAYQSAQFDMYHTHREYTTRATITETELNDAGDSGLYIEKDDIVICFTESAENLFHPYSAVGQQLLADTANEIGGYNYTVTIVDNDRVFGDRYININNKVYRIKATTDLSRENGVYVSTSGEEITEDGRTIPEKLYYYPFDKAEKEVSLYRDAVSARTHGDINTVRQLELKDLEFEAKRTEYELKSKSTERDIELQLLKRSNIELKESVEKEKTIREEAIARAKADYEHQAKVQKEKYELELRKMKDDYDMKAKAQKDTYELEQQQRKYRTENAQTERKIEYENRQLARKDTSDLLKTVGNIITGVVALVSTALLAFLKFKSS